MTADEYHIARAVLALANSVTRTRNAHLQDLGITTQQADALTFFDDYPNSTISALKDAQHIRHATAQMLIQRLVKRGLIQLTVDPNDHRAKLVQLTPQGSALRQRLKHKGSHTGERLLTGFSETETRQFYEALHKAYENLTHEEDE
ncbi:MarR family winged helix-turn-helix transcriptional regulator [Secundilactobacillus collinoides]|uniref:HTH marR-type domain-containing protein n=1 Tax=Secundilactobacillus collinoides TaxID=33960 RepID=A0A166H173_SECCO|nr:MarR family transcriptional regulator [Secundilactobacillus collinoides]KZL41123.1 hypothetical protein TY91_07765 [Secundilactobacillus collinoides]